jgi:hypothetical protein
MIQLSGVAFDPGAGSGEIRRMPVGRERYPQTVRGDDVLS